MDDKNVNFNNDEPSVPLGRVYLIGKKISRHFCAESVHSVCFISC